MDAVEVTSLQYMHDIGISRPNLEWGAAEAIIRFDLSLDGQIVPAQERVTRDGKLVTRSETLIAGPNGCPLHPRDLDFVRELLERSCFYDLQAMEAEFYWSDPD